MRASRARWRTSSSERAAASHATSTSCANIARSGRTTSEAGEGMRLQGKTAIVTGAGSGFGEGIARRFAQEGARVVVNDINAPGGERVAREVGGRFVQGDVTKSGDWSKLIAAAGPDLAVVVNNAGWTHRNKPYL